MDAIKKLDIEIEHLRMFMPDRFYFDENCGYMQAWQYKGTGWIDALRIDGAWNRRKCFNQVAFCADWDGVLIWLRDGGSSNV